MRKFLVIVALLLLVVPIACASNKVFELGDSYQSIINTNAIQEIAITENVVCIKFSYSSRYQNYHYSNKTKAQQKYRELVQILKQNSVNECLRYGGGKACYIK